MIGQLQFSPPTGGVGGFAELSAVAALILLVLLGLVALVTYVVGGKLGRAATSLSRRVALGDAVEETPIGTLFRSDRHVDEVLGLGVRWIVYLAGATVVASLLGLNRLTQLLFDLVRYSSSVVGAVAVLLVGFVVAGYVARATKDHPVLGGGSLTPLIATVAKLVVYFLVVALALDTLGYSTLILNTIAQGVAIGLGLGVALAVGIGFGLGSQDYFAEHVDDWLGQ